MRRRDFITSLGGAAIWPLGARAQQSDRIYRLGFLIPAGRQTPPVVAFFDELRLAGFIEGKNLSVVPGGFDVRSEQIAEGVAAIVKSAPDVIVGGPDIYARALQAATRTIPLLSMSEDMVADGLVTSLARPGGNITGISILSPELDGKRQDLLMELAPAARRIAALADSKVTAPKHLQALKDAALARGVELSVFGVARPEEIVPAINEAKASNAQALHFLATPLFNNNLGVFINQVTAVRLPAMYQWPEMAEAGGLAAYGSRLTQVFRQRAQMVVKVLRGAKPADLPVEQPTRFELVINLEAAKAIGHEVPAALVLRADKVIE